MTSQDIKAGKVPYFEGVVIPERQQQLLTGLLGELPEKRLKRNGEPTTNMATAEWGFNQAIDQVVQVIERLLQGEQLDNNIVIESRPPDQNKGRTIQLPDLPYFQIECTGTTADRWWKSTIYETKNLPAMLFTEENSKRYREGL